MKRVLISLLCIIMVMYCVPTMAFAEGENNIQIEITANPQVNVVENLYACDEYGRVADFTINENMKSFDVTLKTGSEASGKCRINVKDVADNVQLIAVDTQGIAWNIVKSGWGPADGFNVPANYSATTKVYAFATDDGNYTGTVQLVTAGAETSTVLASKDIKAAAANIQIDITDNPQVNVVESLYACDEYGRVTSFTSDASMKSFDVTLKTGGKASGACRINVEDVADGVQLIAIDTQGNAWDIVKSGWGPADGFNVPANYSVTTKVYAFATKAGNYTGTVQVVTAGTEPSVVLASKNIESTAELPVAAETQDFGLWGENWKGAYNVGWKYAEGFDTSKITKIRVGITDIDGNAILTYTAEGDQLDYQRDNGYIGVQSSAPFYMEYKGTEIAEGPDSDWTVEKGCAFKAFAADKAFVEITTYAGIYKITWEAMTNHSHEWSDEYFVDKEATVAETGLKHKECKDQNCIAKQFATIDKLPNSFGGGGGYVPADTLKEQREEAVKNVTDYVKASDYAEAQQAEIKNIVDDAKKKIEAAKTADEIKTIEAAAKAELDKLETAEELATIEAVKSIKFAAHSKRTTLNGKKAIRVTWNAPQDIKLDGYEVYRSTERYSGFGTEPIFTTQNQKYTNNKGLKSGKTYYYKVRGFKYVNDEKVYTEYSYKAIRTMK